MLRTFFTSVCFALSAGLSSAATQQEQFYPADSFSGAWLAGSVANNDNKPDIAIEYYRQALGFDPNNDLVQPDLMLTLLATGRFDEALPLANQLRAYGNVDVQRFSHLVLAADAMRRHHYAQAKKVFYFDKADAMEEITAALVGAWASFGEKKPQQAIKQLETLKGQDWYTLFSTYHMALMYDLMGNKQQAERAYQQAAGDEKGGMSAPDTYERIIMAYASFLTRNGEKQRAIAVLEKAETILSGRHVFAELRKQIASGAKQARLVANPTEGAAEAVYNLGSAINRAGAESYAYIYLWAAQAINPRNDAIYYQLAEAAAKTGKAQQAIGLYRKVRENSPYFHDTVIRLALNEAEAGAREQAIKRLDALLARDPQDSQIVSILASVYMQAENFQQAAATLGKLLDKPGQDKPENGNLYFQRGIAYERLKIWDKAEPDFRRALAFSPNNPQLLNYLGYSLIDRNMKLDEALNMVQRAAAAMPQDGFIVDSLGWAYYKLGRYQEAVNVLEQAVRLRPQDAALNDHLGDAYWQAGRKLEATFQWNHAITGKPQPDELAKIREKLKHGLQEDKTLTGQTEQGG